MRTPTPGVAAGGGESQEPENQRIKKAVPGKDGFEWGC
jgi:hypothetical protein